MKTNRPVNLALTTLKFPITAIVSILHRASGVFLFLMLPVLLWMLSQSLHSAKTFSHLQAILSSGAIKFCLWILLAGIIYHFVAGIRHLLMDAGIAEGRQSGRFAAILVLAIAIILTLLAGVWLW